MNVRRAKRDRWIMGVCGGIAHSYGWSPGLVRAGTAVLAIIIPGPSLLATGLVYFLLGFFLSETDAY